MSFYNEIKKYKDIDLEHIFETTDEKAVLKSLSKEFPDYKDFLRLLSPAAEPHLELMAQKANRLTIHHFGKSVNLYTPIYISNHCINNCAYCGFSVKNSIKRSRLSLDEVESEAMKIAEKGFKHILLLTGESKKDSSIEYIDNSVSILKKYFSSIGIEVYPMDSDEYKKLVDSGVDSLTVYQETYNEKLYDDVHISGPKKDFEYRLLAPERAADAGIYSIGIGALLGLNENWREDAFYTGLHAKYLHDRYPDINISVSMPRIRPETGGYMPAIEIEDKNLVQYILAIRIFLPRVSITISTRESADLRNNLIPLGVNRISAESNTSVGSDNEETSQFEISDSRSLDEIKAFLIGNGYRPVMKDWEIGR